MSASSTDTIPFVFDVLRQIFNLQYFALASITILYYDHVLTLPTEIERIWRPKLSPVSVIFLLNRYLACLGYIPIIFFFFDSPHDDKPCLLFSRYPGVLNCISQVLIGAILIIRAYALYYRQVWILVLTCSLGVATVGVSAWSLMAITDINIPCGPNDIFRVCLPAGLSSTLPFQVNWYLSVAFDTTVSVLTLMKTYEMYRNHRNAGIHSELVNLFLRDGSLYFALMAVANIANLIMFKRNANTFLEESTGNNSVLTHTLSVTVASRLVLNIRTVGSHDTPDPSTSSPQMSTDFHRRSTWVVRDMASIIPPDIDGSYGTTATTATTVTESSYEMTPLPRRKTRRTGWKPPES
ncbi:hypothetical protein BD410DRAFT_796160 [Rickenella mellea]|uniref:DUF6533 domain-containing protein n=1 Tax=Rickenella mellea TaxID=50990 RepID=A0A4Y7PJM5_9AGAM|nr:hypothetical protein BD410DRAFT_796160 [Rickenella mellea]